MALDGLMVYYFEVSQYKRILKLLTESGAKGSLEDSELGKQFNYSKNGRTVFAILQCDDILSRLATK